MFEEWMDQLNADLEAPELPFSLAEADAVELVTDLGEEAQEVPEQQEVRQHLVLEHDGHVAFRSYTAGKGPGKRGIGRVQETDISPAAMQEILQLLDAFWYFRKDTRWSGTKEEARWVLFCRRAGEGTGMIQGELSGAFVAGMDLSFFMRQRIPIPKLFLFDGAGDKS